MKEYMKSTIQKKSDHVVLHVGKNNLNSEKEQKIISKSIVDLVCTLESNSVDVSISNIIVCNEEYNEKGIAVNNV